jgi:nitrite reductase (NADH) small subunit
MNSDFVRIGNVSELPPEGEAKAFACETRELCVARIDGQITAIDNVCPHRGGPLAQGSVVETKIVCPWHGWEFDLATGLAPGSTTIGAPVYEIKTDGEYILVKRWE